MHFKIVVNFRERKNRQKLGMNFGDFYGVNFINSLENAIFWQEGCDLWSALPKIIKVFSFLTFVSPPRL